MIKVAFAALAPFISGSERCLQLILENATAVNIDPLLITPKGSPMHSWATKRGIKHVAIDLNAINKRKPLNWLTTQASVFWTLKKYNIEVLHSNQIWSFKVFDAATRLLNIKRVCHFRDPITSGSTWWLPSNIDIAIFISKHIENEFRAHFPQEHFKEFATLIDPVKLPPRIDKLTLPALKAEAKRQLGITSETFVYGFIGQLAPVKGLLELIAYLAKMQDRDWILVIAGKDPSSGQEYLARCKKLIENLGLEQNIMFLGFIEDTIRFYLACDVITMFSLEEPLGLIPLEAAANYTPTIASAVGGLPETIMNKKTGWLVDLENDVEVLKVLQLVKQVELTCIGRNAREFVESICSPKVYCENMKRLIAE